MIEKPTDRSKRFSLRIGGIIAVTALVVAPLTALATHTFSDVPETHTFHDDIAWLSDSGITRGCNPPANTEFCPEDEVTRGQMAAFMRRFAQYLGAEDGSAAQADNADTVGGKAPNELASTITGAVHSGSPLSIPWVTPTKLLEMTVSGSDGNVALVMTNTEADSSTGGHRFRTWVQYNNADCSAEVEVPGSLVRSPNNVDGGAVFHLTAQSSLVMELDGDSTLTLCAWANGATTSIEFDPVTLSVVQSHNGSANTP